MYRLLFLFLTFFSFSCFALLIESGAQVFSVDSDDETVEGLKKQFSACGTFSFTVPVQKVGRYSSKANRDQGKYLGHPREFSAEPSGRDVEDVRYIVLTLANRSVLGIAKDKDLVEKAGDRIDHLHPLKFLQVIFTDDELKVGVKNIREKGWLWSSFIDGIAITLEVESRIGNLTGQMIGHFANTVGVKAHDLMSYSKEGAWEKMVDYLIANVPRERDDSDRYDF
jgi:hypothetical protein